MNSKTSNRVYSTGTEELAHLEMIGAIVYQLTRNLTPEEIEKSGFTDYFVDHTTGVYPQAASGLPYTAVSMQVKGDTITDLHEDMAAEGTIAKEQLVIRAPERALFYKGSRVFRVLAQNHRLRPHKNNKLQKYDRTSCFRRKDEHLTAGLCNR